MVSDINFLLVGNSRLHWASYSQNQSKFFHTKKEQKVPKNIDINKLILASVGKLPNFLLKEENKLWQTFLSKVILLTCIYKFHEKKKSNISFGCKFFIYALNRSHREDD